jgi:phytol kinase
MIAILLIVFLSLLFLFGTEYISRKQKFPPELTRKFIHISGGTVAAFCPWFLSWHQIEGIVAILFVIMLLARIFHIFESIYSVKRSTLGDLFFALSIGLVAIITHDRLIFAAAVLHMSLADGLAAVFGTTFGKGNGYKVLGQQKSIVGSSVFWLCSELILLGYILLSHTTNNWSLLIWIPLLATGLEAIGVQGTDNLLVPAAVALILSRL